MNKTFYYKIILPFSKKFIKFKELSTQNQLDIEKINLFYPQTQEYHLDYHENFLKIIENCIENFQDFLECDILDYLLFCVKLRILSVGNILELYLKSDDPTVKNKKITLDLDLVIRNILIAGSESLIHKEVFFEERNLKVELGWPNIKSIKSFFDLFFSNLKMEEKIFEIIPEFISSVYINKEKIDFKILSREEKEKITNLFPASVKNKIQQAILENINKISTFKMLDVSFFENQKFNFFNLIYIEIIKLLFTQGLKKIYEEIYILSTYNMSSEYVLNISPTERKLYVSFVELQRKSQEPPDARSDAMNMPPIPMEPPLKNAPKSVEDLAVEFGDIPPN